MTSAWVNQKRYTTFPYINHEWKAKYVTYPRSAQVWYWMPGLQPGWTRKDTQHFPILTMTEKLSMFYIPEALRHLMLNARTSAWINQKGYTTFPYINHYIYPKNTQKGYTTFPFIDHEWKAKYVTYPRSAQALYWMPGLQPGWTRKDTQHFPILTMTEKLSMFYIPEALRHLMLNARTSAWVNQKGYTTFPYIYHKWKTKYVTYPRSAQALYWMPGLGEPQRIHKITLY